MADAELRREVPRRIHRVRRRSRSPPPMPPEYTSDGIDRKRNDRSHPAPRGNPAATSWRPRPPSNCPMSTETAAPVPMVNVQIDGVWMQFPKGTRVIEACAQARQVHPALLLSPEALRRRATAACASSKWACRRWRPDRKPVIGADGKPEIAWIPRPQIACAQDVSRRHGHPHRLADGAGMPQGRDGVSADQSSARLPDLRPGGRVQAAGIFRRVRQRPSRASSSRRSRSRRTSSSARASRSTPSAASSARAAFAS